MSFILGLSLVVVLIPFNTLMIKLTRKLPPQAGQIILYTSLIIKTRCRLNPTTLLLPYTHPQVFFENPFPMAGCGKR